MHTAVYKLLMALNTNTNCFSLFILSCMHTCRKRILYMNTEIQVCCFQAGHLLEQTDFSSASIFINGQVQKKDSGKQMLAYSYCKHFMFTVIKLKSSIRLKHLNIRDLSGFHLELPRHSQFFRKYHRLNWT